MTVEVNIRLLGVFLTLLGKSKISLDLKRPTVGSVVLKLSEQLSDDAKHLLLDPDLNDPRPNALILVNGKEISVLGGLETELKDGDEVTLIPISHGG